MIRNLQILRAIAALLVVFFHCDFLGLKIGQFGVDIFFVISGFIISFVVNRNTKHFLLRRFIRVMPMYYFFTIGLVAVWMIYPNGFRNVVVSAEAILKSLCFIPYYIGDSGPILSLGWTLNYEMYFYLLVGLFLFFVRKPKLALIVASTVIISLVLYNVVTDTQDIYMRFYGHQIALEFIFGIVLYYLTAGLEKSLKKKSWIIASAVLGIASFTLLCYFDYNRIYENRMLEFGIPAFFVVQFFILSEHITNTDSRLHKYFYEVGNASYVIYLCHPFIIFFVIRVVEPMMPSGLFFSVIRLVLMLSLVVIISRLVHKRLELPVVRFLEKKLHRAES